MFPDLHPGAVTTEHVFVTTPVAGSMTIVKSDSPVSVAVAFA